MNELPPPVPGTRQRPPQKPPKAWMPKAAQIDPLIRKEWERRLIAGDYRRRVA